MQCDTCGSEKDVSPVVLSIQESSERLSADMCAACLKKMSKQFNLMDTFKSTRTTKIWDYDSIPRNTP